MRVMDRKTVTPKPATVHHIHLELTEDEMICLASWYSSMRMNPQAPPVPPIVFDTVGEILQG